MTDDTRTAVLEALWAAVRVLVPTSKLVELPRLIIALEHTYNDYGAEQFGAGYRVGLNTG